MFCSLTIAMCDVICERFSASSCSYRCVLTIISATQRRSGRVPGEAIPPALQDEPFGCIVAYHARSIGTKAIISATGRLENDRNTVRAVPCSYRVSLMRIVQRSELLKLNNRRLSEGAQAELNDRFWVIRHGDVHPLASSSLSIVIGSERTRLPVA
jgi:hypothetical protein